MRTLYPKLITSLFFVLLTAMVAKYTGYNVNETSTAKSTFKTAMLKK